jgi:cellulose synthase/poly-beta-1,6-N-acetylglucosamine synthase-like glycosyltransferase
MGSPEGRQSHSNRDMIHHFAFGALIVVNALLLPFFVYLLALTVAALSYRWRAAAGDRTQARFLVVIPAHDEEAGIAATVASCRSLDYPEERFEVLVIADNCSDATAQVASQAGARVVERFDTQKRSKGYALEFLFDTLFHSGEADRYDAIVVVDADTRVASDLLRWLARDLDAGQDWVQCYYTVSNADASWRTRLLTYAFSLFNGVWLLGEDRLGLGATFRGNGMCFSTRGLRRHPWRVYGLTEDMEFAWTLRLAGERIHFRPEARVFGEMVSRSGAGATTQRQRWEVGRRAVRRSFLGPILTSSHRGPLWKLAAALDLTCPPLVGLGARLLAVTILDLVAVSVLGIPSGLLILLTIMLVSLALYTTSPYLAMRLPWRYAADLVYVPVYVFWKVVVALRAAPDHWVRTRREQTQPTSKK